MSSKGKAFFSPFLHFKGRIYFRDACRRFFPCDLLSPRKPIAEARDPLVGARGYREHAAELWLGGDAAGAVAEWQKALKATVEEPGAQRLGTSEGRAGFG